MPVYEFYCSDCHTIFSFFSRKVNTSGCPTCPRCRKRKLERQVSAFAMTGKAQEGAGGMGDLPVDEAKMEKAVTALAGEAESINENDPRQAARLMRKFSSMTGLEFNETVKTAIDRMEAGEDPEKIEAEIGDQIGDEDPFVLPEKGGKGRGAARRRPSRDNTLYEM